MTEAGAERQLPWFRGAVLLLLFLFLSDRLLLIFGQPDLLHDLDPGELKHMSLATSGLFDQGSLLESLKTWLSGPENVHHGGYAVVSVLFAGIAKIFGASLHALRMIPILSALAAAGLVTLWLRRRAGEVPALLGLALLVGAPLLFLKWTCVARGGHTEAVVFAPLMLLLLDRGLSSERRSLWLLAGAIGGFAVYFSYLAAPLVVVLSLGGLGESWLRNRRGALTDGVTLAVGGIIGFSPWLFGWLVLELPYFATTVHASANPNEAAEVLSRGVLGGVRGAIQGLPHNLWPWTFTELQSPAYGTDPSDLLPFEPSLLDWVGRAIMTLGGLLALAAAWVRRSPLIAAMAVLPALHYLFVARLANAGAWPDIPHRYLVLVFPIAAANTALGVGWLRERTSLGQKSIGRVLAGAVVLLALLGFSSHLRWAKAPQPDSLSHWNAAEYQQAGLGQVRLSNAVALAGLTSQFRGEFRPASLRGAAKIFRPSSDYYLLWRGEGRRDAPYPRELFLEPDPLTPENERAAVVAGAYGATVVRADGDASQLDAWLCSWRPSDEFEEAVTEIFLNHSPALSCRPSQETEEREETVSPEPSSEP